MDRGTQQCHSMHQTESSATPYASIFLKKILKRLSSLMLLALDGEESSSNDEVTRKKSFNSPQALGMALNKNIPSSSNKILAALCAIQKFQVLFFFLNGKFQVHLLNQNFTLITDCKSLAVNLKNDVKNLASKQIFVRWQQEFSVFDFDVKHISGKDNCIPDFLTQEFY